MDKRIENLLNPPIEIVQGIEKLNALVKEYPIYIPLPKVATFLGADAEGLRNSIEKGQCPFGIGWKKSNFGNKAFKIPTVTFYLWYTQAACFRNEY